MDGTEFDPGTGTDGADKVVSLVLPDAAQSIKAGTFSNPTFKDFTSLASLSGAGIETVGGSAFYGCTSLASVSLPAVTSIGGSAFYGCTSLASVSLPAATSIGADAFRGCTSLASVSLPATPPSIGSSIFYYTGYNATGTITVSVPTGAVPAYTAAWGVDANTPADGNTSVYGPNHKAVLITAEG